MIRGIYVIVGPSQKRYLGASQDIDQRWREHRSDLFNNKHHSLKLQRAWNKHGRSAFRFEVLELVEGDLDLAEQNWLDRTLNAYNVSADARAPMRGRKGASHPAFGKPHPISARAKQLLSLAQRRHQKKHGNPMKGRRRPDIAELNKARGCSPATRAKLSAAAKARLANRL